MMGAKSVVRRAGRVMGLSYPANVSDRLANMIPFDLKMTLDKALKQSAELKQAYESEYDVPVDRHGAHSRRPERAAFTQPAWSAPLTAVNLLPLKTTNTAASSRKYQ